MNIKLTSIFGIVVFFCSDIHAMEHNQYQQYSRVVIMKIRNEEIIITNEATRRWVLEAVDGIERLLIWADEPVIHYMPTNFNRIDTVSDHRVKEVE